MTRNKSDNNYMTCPAGKRPIFYRLGTLFAVVCSLFILTSCDLIYEDFPEPTIEPTVSVPDKLYFSLDVKLPSTEGTRSETTDKGESSDGYLQGQDMENMISSAYLYFFEASNENKSKNNYVTHFIVSESKKIVQDPDNDRTEKDITYKAYKVYAKLDFNEIKALCGKNLHLYVLANMGALPMSGTLYGTEQQFLASTFSYTMQDFGTDGEGQLCPMTNNDYFKIDLRGYDASNAQSKAEIYEAVKGLFTGTYTDPDTNSKGMLWTVGNTLSLERSIARVDYKPSSGTSISTPNVYKMTQAEGDVYVKIVSMQLFNVAKDAYTFKHTAEGDASGAAAAIHNPFGSERGQSSDKYNWIADCDWSQKLSENPSLNLNFQNQMTSSTDSDGKTTWSFSGNDGYIKIDNLTTTENDGYHPWHYIGENTLPSTEKMTPELSTGVAFRMVVCDVNGTPIGKNGDTYRITLKEGERKGYYTDIKYTDNSGKGENAEPSGYYLTYNYLIEHNNQNSTSSSTSSTNVDGNSGTPSSATDFGAMRIGIVRNNVYQLSVTGVNTLPNPNEPDNFALTMEINVLPWYKRRFTVDWW